MLENFGISRDGLYTSCLPTLGSWSDLGTAAEAVTSIAAVSAADMPNDIGIPDIPLHPPDEDDPLDEVCAIIVKVDSVTRC